MFYGSGCFEGSGLSWAVPVHLILVLLPKEKDKIRKGLYLWLRSVHFGFLSERWKVGSWNLTFPQLPPYSNPFLFNGTKSELGGPQELGWEEWECDLWAVGPFPFSAAEENIWRKWGALAGLLGRGGGCWCWISNFPESKTKRRGQGRSGKIKKKVSGLGKKGRKWMNLHFLLFPFPYLFQLVKWRQETRWAPRRPIISKWPLSNLILEETPKDSKSVIRLSPETAHFSVVFLSPLLFASGETSSHPKPSIWRQMKGKWKGDARNRLHTFPPLPRTHMQSFTIKILHFLPGTEETRIRKMNEPCFLSFLPQSLPCLGIGSA